MEITGIKAKQTIYNYLIEERMFNQIGSYNGIFIT